MKYLSDIIKDRQSELFKKHHVIFAFSAKQFEEQREEGITYVNFGSGMLINKATADEFIDEYTDLIKKAIQEDIDMHTLEGVIRRELANHEAYYTWSITSTVEALADYPGATEEKINSVFQAEQAKDLVY